MFMLQLATQRRGRLASLLAFGVLSLLGQTAYAIGTDANTLVTNNVTVDYQVSGTAQTQLTSSTAFRVDNKINMSIGVTNDTVIPGEINQVLTYVITNTGNATQSYALTVANSSIADNFDMNTVRIYVETNGTAGWQVGDTLYTSGSGNKATGAANVLEDGTLTVYVVSDVPPAGGGTAPVNGNAARYDLLVTTLNATAGAINTAGVVTTGDNAAAWTQATMQNVFADTVAGTHASDTVNDGEFSAVGVYTVTTAALTVTKSVVVSSNPAGVTGVPKAIPGATLTYSIVLNNTAGAVAATTMVVNDDFPELTLTFVNNTTDVAITGGGTDNNITNNTAGANTGATVTISSQGGTAENDRVAVSTFTVPAGQTATITFDVLVD